MAMAIARIDAWAQAHPVAAFLAALAATAALMALAGVDDAGDRVRALGGC